MTEDPIVIRRTSTVEEAEIVVAWLSERDINAFILDRDNPGVLAFGITDEEGIAIAVAQGETAQRAVGLLEVHHQEHLQQTKAHADAGTASIEVICEECGTQNVYAVAAAGTVQECEECRAFLDVEE